MRLDLQIQLEEYPASLVHLADYSRLANKPSLQENRECLRVFKLAHPAEFLALDTARVIWITLDLLLSASDARNSKSLSRLPGLGDTPVGIHNLSINHRLAVRPIIVEVAHSFARDIGLTYEARQKLGTGPDLWP